MSDQIDPELVIHLGDIVNPVPELPTYADAAGHFKSLVADLKAPLHLVAGNHDVGDKPVSWMPAGTVNDEHLELYQSHFGKHYFSFDHGDLRFVVVNAPIINSGLSVEAAQRKWLESELVANKGKRIFICIHYPPYVSNPDENSSYDNIDEPGRSWLVDLIERSGAEAVFCGHVHNFWYDRIADTEMYILPSTAFVRHDYSEFFRIEPGEQNGRNDTAKLGYFVVRVYEQGHVAENIRSYGRTLAPGASLAEKTERIQPVHSKESRISSTALDMRQPWAEELEITPSGVVDEFERKISRNDYPLLALWETGLRRLRLPIQDLMTVKTRRRVEIMKEIGHEFHVYLYGVPNEAQVDALRKHHGLIDRLEVVCPWTQATETLHAVAAHFEGEIYLSRVNRSDGVTSGGKYNHLISHGFDFAEEADLAGLLDDRDVGDIVNGFMFRVPRNFHPFDAGHVAIEVSKTLERGACLYMRTSGDSPADAYFDEPANAGRVAEALCVGAGFTGVDTVLDTFADMDRGYFTRSGLVDRRYNPKLGSRVVANLMALLNNGNWRTSGPAISEGGLRVCTLEQPGGEALSLIHEGDGETARKMTPTIQEHLGRGKVFDLSTGLIVQDPSVLPPEPFLFALTTE